MSYYVIERTESMTGEETGEFVCVNPNKTRMDVTTDKKKALKFYDYDSAEEYMDYCKKSTGAKFECQIRVHSEGNNFV